MRALLLGLLLSSCGSGEKANSDGGSNDTGVTVDATPGGGAACALDGECAPGDACAGALPGVARSGRCQPRGERGLAPECLSP